MKKRKKKGQMEGWLSFCVVVGAERWQQHKQQQQQQGNDITITTTTTTSTHT